MTDCARLDSAAELIVGWQELDGRNHLPWQQTRDPYRVWLSEIMLQQTQVKTVLEYYERFLQRFPDVRALAFASADEVMGLWSGLGYYSRARNLHRCAQKVVHEYGGYFPPNASLLANLPGIGRSTAGAIAAFCFSERVPILDANVRRVLTRYLGFDADLASAKNERLLWDSAETLLPVHDLETSMPRYTQGLMDLGAMLCTPRSPQCDLCPLRKSCVARKNGDPERYPVKTRKISRRSESWHLLVLKNVRGQVWLERRPQAGIWAGMHCVPVYADHNALESSILQIHNHTLFRRTDLQPSLHVLTHRDLHLHAVVLDGVLCEKPFESGEWLGSESLHRVGLPAPIRKLLDSLQTQLF